MLADDLTGALDATAQFVRLIGPVRVFLEAVDVPEGIPAAFDSASREVGEREAVIRVARIAPLLRGGRPAFKKLDSLLRGQAAAEIATCLRIGGFHHAVIAPAFPAQGRVTRRGSQFARQGHGEWQDVGVDLVGNLERLGLAVALRRPGDHASGGISLWDACNEADLAKVAVAGRRLSGQVLWCGTAGLAAALAGGRPCSAPCPTGPVLACIGSNHPVSLGQLQQAAAFWVRVQEGGADAARIAERLENGSVAVSLALPPGLARDEVAQRVRVGFAQLLAKLPPPPALLVSGGETLRGVCLNLGVQAVEVEGEILPGIPTAVLRGGDWEGVRLVSKSGAFGAPDLLRRLLTNGVS